MSGKRGSGWKKRKEMKGWEKKERKLICYDRLL